jgi:hypothetical protein
MFCFHSLSNKAIIQPHTLRTFSIFHFVIFASKHHQVRETPLQQNVKQQNSSETKFVSFEKRKKLFCLSSSRLWHTSSSLAHIYIWMENAQCFWLGMNE